MNKIDTYSALDLDGYQLRLLVAVLDSGSVTAAAQELELTQSAISHRLQRLRALTGDPLFVKSGRGIVATAHAERLGEQARALLRGLAQFARPASFDPAQWQTTLTIAANDFQRDLLLPALAQLLRKKAPQVNLRIIPSSVPRLDMLRADDCQLVISPRPPDGTDIVQKRLFTDRYKVFYDASQRPPPLTRADYVHAEHATVVYDTGRRLDLDQHLQARGVQRQLRVMVPNLSALGTFVRGTSLLTTAPSLLAHSALRELAQAKPPVPCPTLSMYMIWHARYQEDAAHRWLRDQVQACVPSIGAGD